MIREATIEDVSVLLKLAFEFHKEARYKRLATFEESLPCWQKWLETCIEADHLLCLIAEKEADAVGFCTAIMFPAYWNSSVVAVQETAMWVAPKHRSSGVGSGIIEAMVKWAKEHGARVVAAGSTVYMDPKRMGAFLRKHGFKLEERNYSKVI